MIGTYINYYFHCPRHLWLFAHNVRMEHTSEDVAIGKIISEYSYDRKNHEIYISQDENEAVIDFFDKKRKVIHEIKKTNKMEELHIWQVKYYLYILKKIGLEGVTGEIDYPRLKRLIKVTLTEEDEKEIEKTIKEINRIVELTEMPSVIHKPYCKKCSYFELCYC